MNIQIKKNGEECQMSVCVCVRAAWISGRLNFYALYKSAQFPKIHKGYAEMLTFSHLHRHLAIYSNTVKEAGKWSPLIRFHVKIKPLFFCSLVLCVILLIRKWICKSVSILRKKLESNAAAMAREQKY